MLGGSKVGARTCLAAFDLLRVSCRDLGSGVPDKVMTRDRYLRPYTRRRHALVATESGDLDMSPPTLRQACAYVGASGGLMVS